MSYSAAWPPQSKLGYPTTLLRMFKVQMSLRQVTCVIAEARIRDRDWLFESLIGKSCCLKENKRKYELALNLHEGSAGDRRHHLVANAHRRSAIWDLGILMRSSRAQNSHPNTRLQSQSREKAPIAIFIGKSQRQVWDFTGQASNQVTKTTLDASCQKRDRESEWTNQTPHLIAVTHCGTPREESDKGLTVTESLHEVYYLTQEPLAVLYATFQK